MSYSVIRSPEGTPRVVLQGEPPYCHCVAPAKPASGRWLVLVFSAWSLPDVRAVQPALDAVKRFNGAVQLGLRPSDDTGPENEAGMPAWLFFEDGEIALERRGLMAADAVATAIEAAFPALAGQGSGA